MGQKKLACYQETGNRRHDGDMFVDLTIHDVPACLLKEFGEKVVAPATQAESTRQSRACSEKPSSKNRQTTKKTFWPRRKKGMLFAVG